MTAVLGDFCSLLSLNLIPKVAAPNHLHIMSDDIANMFFHRAGGQGASLESTSHKSNQHELL